MTTNLVARLRDKYASPQDVAEAADMIERLEAGNREFAFLRNDDLARIKELEAALRPFAAAADILDKEGWDNLHIDGSNADVTGEHCRAARAALEGKNG